MGYNNTYANGNPAYANTGKQPSSEGEAQPTLANHTGKTRAAPPPSFFAKRVVKPIRGGGKRRTSNVFEMNPYGQQDNNKEYNNYAMKVVRKVNKFHKPPPSNPFTPIVRPGEERDSPSKGKKSIRQIQKESKKQHYMDDFMKAQQMLMDDSINNPDESINIDGEKSSDEEDNQEEILSGLENYPKRSLRSNETGRQSLGNFHQAPSLLGTKDERKPKYAKQNVPTRTVNLGGLDGEEQNPFQPKKKKGLGSTLSKVWKGIF